MMKTGTCLLFFCLNFLFFGCGSGEWDTTLYVQKIEGTSKVLYKYNAWGGRDTHLFGYVLLDSTETFKVHKRKRLPFSYLKEVPNKNYIYGVDFEKTNLDTPTTKETDRIFTPIENLNIKQDNIDIKVDTYQYSGFLSRSSGYDKYTFESFKETRDSLFFYNLKPTLVDAKKLHSLKFKKRNIVISQNDKNEIIAINDLKISDSNNEIFSNRTYSLIPKNTIKSGSFSDYGIFKEKI